MKRISRRNFLKAMGISATALTLAACGGGSSSSTAAGTAGFFRCQRSSNRGTQGRRNPSPVLFQPHCHPRLHPPCHRQRCNLLPDAFLRESGQL